MNNVELKEKITQLLKNNLKTTYLELIDETHKHVKHKNFQSNKFHFKLKISSSELDNKSKLNAHKQIYQCLGTLMQTHIHALSIQII